METKLWKGLFKCLGYDEYSSLTYHLALGTWDRPVTTNPPFALSVPCASLPDLWLVDVNSRAHWQFDAVMTDETKNRDNLWLSLQFQNSGVSKGTGHC